MLGGAEEVHQVHGDRNVGQGLVRGQAPDAGARRVHRDHVVARGHEVAAHGVHGLPWLVLGPHHGDGLDLAQKGG
jgi:hypothetical protein